MRVLHIQLDMVMGGIEAFLLNVYKRIDRNKIQFDFIEYGYEERKFDYQYVELGANIFRLPDRRKNPFKARNELKQIIKRNGYKVVHIHKNSLSDISAIKICGRLKVPTIIIHSHNSCRDSKIITAMHKLNLYHMDFSPYVKFACSKEAGKWLFGDYNKAITIVNNGIDLEKFKYNPEVRDRIRRRLGIDQFYVIGTVGRLTNQKNPYFLIKVFHQLRKTNSQLKLLWVGDGELKPSVEEIVDRLGEASNVHFTGRVLNPQNYYQAIDLFVMTSFYEGFPIAAIEAQANGLPCILADSITREADITDMVEFLALDEGEHAWAEKISDIIKEGIKRRNQTDIMRQKGYDIQDTVNYLQAFYLKANDSLEIL
jgi:glycosyltransferase involved in cell wall biosynthesis|nr:glycosyltransferase family 1 protein [uncultured Acetatifactor sp.]